jgi:hypothetical protein
LRDARHQNLDFWELASGFHGGDTLLKIQLNAAVRDMKGAKPRKPLYLVSVREGDLEDIVANLTAIPREVFNWHKPLKLSNNAGDGEFPTSNREKP